jgi:hypothetical protein
MKDSIRKLFIVELIAHDSDQWIEMYQARKAGERHLFIRLFPRPGSFGLPRRLFERQLTLHFATGVERVFPPAIGSGL